MLSTPKLLALHSFLIPETSDPVPLPRCVLSAKLGVITFQCLKPTPSSILLARMPPLQSSRSSHAPSTQLIPFHHTDDAMHRT